MLQAAEWGLSYNEMGGGEGKTLSWLLIWFKPVGRVHIE